MRPFVAFGIAVSFAVAGARAQDAPVDPVLGHFREFRAAIERGDTAAAEIAAQAALDASEAVNGPRTAVLALNLATLRLDMGKPNEAYAPAQRAQALAAANDQSGVDRLLAELVVGRAGLTVNGLRNAQGLLDAIGRAQRRGEFVAEAYSAAVDLARTAFSSGQYESARAAWQASYRAAEGSPSEPAFARGLARTGEGAAIFMQAVADAESEREPGAAGAGAVEIERDAARAANEAFGDALGLLREYADVADPSVITLAQGVYAQALAWHSAVRARMQPQGVELPPVETAAAGVCAQRLVAAPAPAYPADSLGASGVGAVVVRITTDAQGTVVDRKIAAAVPSGSFSEAVAAVADQWQVEASTDAAGGCRRDGTQYTPVVFLAE